MGDPRKLTDLFGWTIESPSFEQHAKRIATVLKQFNNKDKTLTIQNVDLKCPPGCPWWKSVECSACINTAKGKVCSHCNGTGNDPVTRERIYSLTPGSATEGKACQTCEGKKGTIKVTYEIRIFKLKLVLTKKILEKHKSGKTPIVSEYIDDKIIFSVTRLPQKNIKKETGLIELIALLSDLKALKKESHGVYDTVRVAGSYLQDVLSEEAKNTPSLKDKLKLRINRINP